MTMQHGHVHAALGKAGRRFKAKQAAADDDAFSRDWAASSICLHVVEIAIGDDARQILAGNRR